MFNRYFKVNILKNFKFITRNNFFFLRTTSECPSCQEQIRRESVTVDHEYQKEIQNLPVFCSNRQFGCSWEGIFKDHNVNKSFFFYILA